FEKFGTLVEHSSKQQTPVRASLNGQTCGRCVLFADQVFGAGDEIVEYILLVKPGSLLMPLFPVLPTAPKVRLDVYTALIEECNSGRTECRGPAYTKPAVGVHQGRSSSVSFESFFINNGCRNPGAVLTRIEYLFYVVVFRFERHFGPS